MQKPRRASCGRGEASFNIQHSTLNIQHSLFVIAMATQNQTPAHEIRPVTQEIPERFIPVPTVEPGHTFATVTDQISAIVLRKRMPKLCGWAWPPASSAS